MNGAQLSTLLHELNIFSIFIRLFMATAFGAILGMDRARKFRPAGFRTHMLVCMGSALVMITNQFLQAQYQTGDPARLGAQVISGIGFLGAGTIIVTRRSQVSGLTTAAGLWVSACLGLAVGAGFYTASFMGALFLLFIVVFMQGLDEKIQQNSRNLQLYVEMNSHKDLSALLSFASENGINISEVELVETHNQLRNLGAIILLRLPERTEQSLIINELSRHPGVEFLGRF